jgi:glycogen debranching enzyme
VAAYPGIYGDAGGSSAILDWPRQHPDQVAKPGCGIPMKALSSNCLYYHAYVVADRMARELGQPGDPAWSRKAAALKAAINRHLWMPEKGWYRFFIGPLGNCDYQEGLGHAYALLFGIAGPEQADAIFRHLHVTPAGMPCVWPTCPRYVRPDGQSFGRHSGTVWPQIQGFWAEACARFGRRSAFEHELFNLARHAVRDHQFAEIYHPLTGEIYGGLQEAGSRGIVLWRATSRQTWAATAFLRMVFFGVAGMRVAPEGIRFAPCLPAKLTRLELGPLRYRRMRLRVIITTDASASAGPTINGQPATDFLLDKDREGEVRIRIRLPRHSPSN